jgi:hypothetical protein
MSIDIALCFAGLLKTSQPIAPSLRAMMRSLVVGIAIIYQPLR